MSTQSLPKLPCLCANFRRAARSLTQLYEEALRPLRLRTTQFTLLQALELAGEVTQGQLCHLLSMDSTTLTRTLEILARRGWIAKRSGKDRRERLISLAARGKEQLRRATPAWEAVQQRVRQQLPQGHWDRLMRTTYELTQAVREIEKA
jgi:DNA-binding MarR family transcriptional regulator